MPAKNITAMFKDVEDKMMKPTWNKTELGKLKVDLLPNITALKGEKEDFIANKLDGLSKDIDVMEVSAVVYGKTEGKDGWDGKGVLLSLFCFTFLSHIHRSARAESGQRRGPDRREAEQDGHHPEAGRVQGCRTLWFDHKRGGGERSRATKRRVRRVHAALDLSSDACDACMQPSTSSLLTSLLLPPFSRSPPRSTRPSTRRTQSPRPLPPLAEWG